MTETILLLVPSEEPVPPDEIFELTGNDDLHAYTTPEGELLRYEVIWPDVEMRIQFMPLDDVPAKLSELLQQAESLLGEREDRKARKVMRRIQRTKQIMQCEIDPEWDEEGKCERLVRGIITYFDYGFLYANEAFFNENGNLRLGDESTDRKYFRTIEPESPVAAERKRRTIKHLEKEGVPTIDHLPVIADEEQTTIRGKDEIAKRAMALLYVADVAADNTDTALDEYLLQYKLTEDDFTELEWNFLNDPEPEEYLFPYFEQRYESYKALLWALGYVSELGKPEKLANITEIREILLDRSPETFLMEATAHSKTEVLDMADLAYRYHWAVMDALLYDTPVPAGLIIPVAYERHYAMNWLINYKDQDWEDVTTDT